MKPPPAGPFFNSPARQPAAHVLRAMAVAQAKPFPAVAAGLAPPARPVSGPPRLPGRPQQILQRALTFDSSPGARWTPDKSACQVCDAAIGWRSRHHCRVCGRSVCNDCTRARHQVSHPMSSRGRSSSAAASSQRVCVDCVLNRQIDLAGRVPEFADLRRAADAAAGRSGVCVGWDRRCPTGQYNFGKRMIELDPSKDDPFSIYLFELTNAAQAARHRQPLDFRTREDYGSYVENMEYDGTLTHQRVAQAINRAGVGFRVTERFAANRDDAESRAAHLRVQLRSHTLRYYQQWDEDHAAALAAAARTTASASTAASASAAPLASAASALTTAPTATVATSVQLRAAPSRQRGAATRIREWSKPGIC